MVVFDARGDPLRNGFVGVHMGMDGTPEKIVVTHQHGPGLAGRLDAEGAQQRPALVARAIGVEIFEPVHAGGQGNLLAEFP